MRLDSLDAEKKFLITENKELKKKRDELQTKQRGVEVQLSESENANKQKAAELEIINQKISVLDLKWIRATKVAAHLEKLLRVPFRIYLGVKAKCQNRLCYSGRCRAVHTTAGDIALKGISYLLRMLVSSSRNCLSREGCQF